MESKVRKLHIILIFMFVISIVYYNNYCICTSTTVTDTTTDTATTNTTMTTTITTTSTNTINNSIEGLGGVVSRTMYYISPVQDLNQATVLLFVRYYRKVSPLVAICLRYFCVDVKQITFDKNVIL